jgi:hypothetical protein
MVTAAWTEGYYQYANRLAYLHFLQAHGLRAHLLFVYFCRDIEMKGPASTEEWKRSLRAVYSALGLLAAPSGVVNAFVDVEPLATAV